MRDCIKKPRDTKGGRKVWEIKIIRKWNLVCTPKSNGLKIVILGGVGWGGGNIQQ